MNEQNPFWQGICISVNVRFCALFQTNINWGFQTEIIYFFVFFNEKKKIVLSTIKMNDKIKIDLNQFIVANYIIHE